jgi:hypothetical protein
MTPRRALSSAMAVLGLALTAALQLLASCADESIPLALIPPDAGSGPLTPCAESDACAPGMYCEKAQCDDRSGLCQFIRSDCTGPQTVCGCDGFTYYNDCLRQLALTSLRAPEQCQQFAKRCSAPEGIEGPCPPGSYCSLVVPPHVDCNRAEGVCWVLPDECPASTGWPMWDLCGGGPPCNGSFTCLDSCNAIRCSAPRHPSQQQCTP